MRLSFSWSTSECPAQIGFGLLDGLLVGRHDAHGREDPGARRRKNLVVGEGNPLLHERRVFEGFTYGERRTISMKANTPDSR